MHTNLHAIVAIAFTLLLLPLSALAQDPTPEAMTFNLGTEASLLAYQMARVRPSSGHVTPPSRPSGTRVQEVAMNRSATSTMTRERSWALTAISVILFILLCWIFDDGLFTAPLWNGENWISSPLLTYLLIAIIILCGWSQARSIPERGVEFRLERIPATVGLINDPVGWRLLMGSIYYALLWLPMRFFIGRDWISHGAEKVVDPAWMNGGEALRSFWAEAVVVPEQGRPPISYPWFRDFLQYMIDNGWYSWFAKLVTLGELLVGIALLVGALVGLSAFIGTFMNFNYMLAGSASTNPVLFGLAVILVLAWKVAGHWGLDRWLLPALGSQWARAEAQVDAVATHAEREAAT